MPHANLSPSVRPSARSLFSLRNLAAAAILLLSGTVSAVAGGPRWVSGPPFFTNTRVMISWYTNQPLYFTDRGDLSPSVNHAAADAMVARAAAVWNVPTASLVLARGGSLDEHLSSANVYATANGLVLPADVQTSNYAAKQIAIVYDSDGSVTNMLLGSGASDPSGCLQTGVTESVDSITPEARIQHALLILNGRCTGPAPEKQLQMQYQLMRAFGRVLGLGWSQTNDNVFTGSPAPTHTQALNWPIMHPIDIICGLYTYQCLPDPFTLRPDDISSLEQLYFATGAQTAPGKLASWSNAGGVYGQVTFANGQGMEQVNVVVQRRAPFWSTAEVWQTASSVSGYAFRGQNSTSMAATGTSAAASMGNADLDHEGFWRIQSVPVPVDQEWTDLVITTEAINPLYTGTYAIGPQAENVISPSGAPQLHLEQYLANGRDNYVVFTPPDAAPTCAEGADGTEIAPAAVPGSGWWTGTLCGYGHHAWHTLPVKANRTLTIEVTALDEHGFVTMAKAMPTVGVWNATDAPGTLPSVASATTAFNSSTLGMTTLSVQSDVAAASFRLAIADQRGAGRPDFTFQARALYADTITPASVGPDGGDVTITGMGFRQGNLVLVNGIEAVVTSWSQTAIVATLPSLHELGYSRAILATVTVSDPSTGGSSVMSGALRYAAPVEALLLVSTPAVTASTGAVLRSAFSVMAVAPDGFTPIAGEPVSFTATGAAATLSPCNASACTILTNAAGIASTSVTPRSAGVVNLTATGRSGSANASVTATSTSDVLHLVTSPSGIVTTGTAATTFLQVQLLSADGRTRRAGSDVTLTVTAGAARLGACSATPCTLSTDASGFVGTTVTPVSTGIISVRFASSSSVVNASFSAAPETLLLSSAPASTETVGVAATSAFAVRLLAGDGVTPVAGETVVFTATGAPVTFGACAGPVCTLTSDAQGMVGSTVTAAAAGTVTLSAIGNAGNVTATFTASIRIRSITAARSVQFVAEGVAVRYVPQVTLADNSASPAGLPVSWVGAVGLDLPASATVSDTAGVALGIATAGPLAAGIRVHGSACAWTTVCTPVSAEGVGEAEWRLLPVSGSDQTVAAGDSLLPVVLRVVNATGDPVAGVPVEVDQTVSGWEAACPLAGRCPLSSTIRSTRQSAVSDIDGLVRILPEQMSGAPAITRIAVIAGSNGFTAISLETHP